MGSRKARQRVIGAAIGSLTLLLGLISIPSSSAGAAPKAPYKYYTAGANPTTIYVGAATPVTITLTNSSTSIQSFGSAEVTFNGVAPFPAPSGTDISPGWTASPVPGSTYATFLLTSTSASAIAPGLALSLTVPLKPTTTGSIPVTTVVKQSNDFSGTGNNFSLSGPPLSIAVASVTLSFQQQPTGVQQTDLSLSSPTFHYMCPPVSVLVTGGSNPISGVSVTLKSGTSTPGLYFGTTPLSPSGTTAVSDSAGIATFGSQESSGSCMSGMAGSQVGSGYSLVATSPAATTSVTSHYFSVLPWANTCTGPPCRTTMTSMTNGTSGLITTNSGAGASTYGILGAFGLGTLSCDSAVTDQTVKDDPIVVQTTTGVSGTISMTFPKTVVLALANNGTPLMQVCAGTTQAFSWTNSKPDYTWTYPYQGLVPNCPGNYIKVTPEICVVSRSKNAANETIVIYVSDLTDPSFW